MQQYLAKSSAFRQWLMREDCPPMLQECLKLLDEAYGFTPKDFDSDGDVINDDNDDNSACTPPSHALAKLAGSHELDCLSRVVGSKGHYTIPNENSLGNSYICFKDAGSRDGKWAAGQIQHIFKYHSGGSVKVAVRRSLALNISVDPFGCFWKDEFEARLISSKFAQKMEIIELSSVIAHTARWVISNTQAVVLNLSMVSHEL